MATSSRLFKKILVANRGEIACRVMRSCRKMGIPSVAIHSEVDARSLHVRMADEAVCVGPAVSAQSYLNMDNIMKAIEITGADAVHPGYGFLSENAEFVKRLEGANVTFIGPKAHAIQAMGDKIQSKLFAEKAKVNVIPGDTSIVPDEEACLKAAHHAGYPVMVKASAGGGGKGMRVAYNDKECREAFRLSKHEALASFGDDRLFVEKYIEHPRHIEIQILCDSHGNGVYLNERECSIQRRNQKVIEEAPSVVLDPATRKAMGDQAIALAHAVQYRSAGTTEFLVDKDKNFYFLEMNTRLQVEHPVTEMTTGVDLVENMIRVAAGEKLSLKQEDIPIKGWAFESRVYAENPLKDFLPSIGRLRSYKEPRSYGAPGEVRVDTGIVEGSEISMYYDPMISKLVTHGNTRAEALEKMREALDTYVVRGVTHNIGFLKALCDHPRFIDGRITTKFIEEEYPDGFTPPALSAEETRAIVSTAVLVHCHEKARREAIATDSSFSMYDKLIVTIDDTQHEVSVGNYDASGSATVGFESGAEQVNYEYTPGDFILRTLIGGSKYISQLSIQGPHDYEFQWGSSGAHTVSVRTPHEEELFAHMPKSAALNLAAVLLSPMPGSVYSVKVKPGMKIDEDDEVAVIEAMKMQNILRAPTSGVVKAVHVAKGDTVAADQLIYELE